MVVPSRQFVRVRVREKDDGKENCLFFENDKLLYASTVFGPTCDIPSMSYCPLRLFDAEAKDW